MTINWKSYNPGKFYDELISSPGYPRKPARILAKYLASLNNEELKQRKATVEHAIKSMVFRLLFTVKRAILIVSGPLI